MNNFVVANALAVAANLIASRRSFLEERIAETNSAIADIDQRIYALQKQRCIHFVERSHDQAELDDLLNATEEFEARSR